jgi:PAS domain S-box-containing protein
MAQARILIVEDEAIVARSTANGLTRLGYDVVGIASMGEEAIQQAMETQPDLVLMDIRLRGSMDGIEAAAQIRQRLDVPVVYLSAHADEATLRKAKITAPLGYLIKPFQIGELNSTIEVALYRHELEYKLKESESRYRALFEAAPDAIILAAAESGRVLDASPAALRLLATSREKLLTLHLWEVHPSGLADTIEELFGDWVQRFESGEQVDPVESTILRSDGQEVPVEIRVRLVQIQGRLAILNVYRDITVRKQHEDALLRRNRELLSLQAAATATASSLDRQFVLETVTWEMASLLEVESCTISEWDRATDTLSVIAFYSSARSQQEALADEMLHLADYPLRRRALTERYIQQMNVTEPNLDASELAYMRRANIKTLLMVPLVVQDRVFGLIEARDSRVERTLSDHELALAQLLANQAAGALENARLYGQAQREIAERRRVEESLRERSGELQERNEELDAFAHTVAHDLQNPVGLVIGFAEVLEESYTTMPQEEVEEYLNIISRYGRKMDSIIRELLLLSSVRKQDAELESLHMAHIVDESLQRLADLIEKHKPDIILPEAWPVALGYAPWIEEVWINYLSNAIKYGGRPPRVELGADELTDEVTAQPLVRFWVRDNGPGLSPDEQARLFVPFTQLAQARTSGHGLGLSIVRRIMDRLDGQVGVESEGLAGRGCVFSFTLPGLAGEEG